MIRKALEKDRTEIATVIAFAYEEDFKLLVKDMKKVALGIASGIDIDKFYVYEIDGIIAGITAVSDINSRALYLQSRNLRKHIGLVKGTLLRIFTKKEFEEKIITEELTGLIECVAVVKNFRGKGISGKIITHIIENLDFNKYILDVNDTNIPAIKTYIKLGFDEYKRKKVPKSHGFNEKVYMHFVKEINIR